MAILAVLALATGVTADDARAVVYTGTGTGDMGDIDFTAIISGAVSLEIVGAADSAGTSTTLTDAAVGTGGVNDVDFGATNSLCSTGPSTGACVVVDNTQANLVATLAAELRYSGIAVPNLAIYRAASTGFGTMQWATGNATDWSTATAGTDIGVGAAAANTIATAVTSGAITTHQIAARIISTDTGTLTSSVTYTVVP